MMVLLLRRRRRRRRRQIPLRPVDGVAQAERNGVKEAVAVSGNLSNAAEGVERVARAELHFLFPLSGCAPVQSLQKAALVNVRTGIPRC